MQTYKKMRAVGLVSALLYAATLPFQGVEALVLKWLFFIIAVVFIRKAHFEGKKINGDNPEEAKRRKRLAYIIVGVLYGFVIVVFIASRFLTK